MAGVPLGVLDLVPISSGSTASEALRNSTDLARNAEQFGYKRYWFAEHHLNPGVAGTSPAVVIALTAAATTTIRLGSGGVQFGHRTPLSTVEEFGLIDALYPGRIDLGIGRSGGRPQEARPVPVAAGAAGTKVLDGRAPNGLRIPARFSYDALAGSPRFALPRALLNQPGYGCAAYGAGRGQLSSRRQTKPAPTNGGQKTWRWSRTARRRSLSGQPALADQLEQMQEATQADEVIVTTITHQHVDRVRSYELLAEEWRDR